MTELILIAHNLRSSHNVGSLLRTAEGLGVSKVWLTGYTPYPIPTREADARLPHVARKTHKQIVKTALGAEGLIDWKHTDDIDKLLRNLRKESFVIAGLEQAPGSLPLPGYRSPAKLALVVGREVEGLEPEILNLCDLCLEIPMAGRKESFNVVQAAAMALYHLRFAMP